MGLHWGDEPAGIARDLQIAKSVAQAVLATRAYMESVARGNAEGQKLARDMELCRRFRHPLLVLLERGATPVLGHFPEWANIVEVD